jgi:hypothetical protein
MKDEGGTHVPLISIPTKAKDEYIRLCHDAWTVDTARNFELKCSLAHGYADAIKDICGLDVWGCIIQEADMSFPEDVGVCCGIPLEPKE